MARTSAFLVPSFASRREPRRRLIAPRVSGARFPVIPDAEVSYRPDFLEPVEADRVLRALLARDDWQRLRSRLFGREVELQRSTAWWGDRGARYRYSGITHVARGWPDFVAALGERLQVETGVRFNSVLANRYRDGQEYMGWHSDDERDLGERPVIASLSFGAERRFLMRHRSRKDLETVEWVLGHGSLLLMAGDTQRHWKHRMPPMARCKEERVNLTFRRVRHASEEAGR